MKVITFSEGFSFEYWAPISGRVVHFEPKKPYLLSDKQVDVMFERKLESFFEKVSFPNSAFRDFNVGTAKKGSKVLFFNGCGGMGDAIMSWPAVKILANYGFEVHILIEPHLEFAWHGFPWVKTIDLLPCYWEQARHYDYHAMFEIISNSYLHDGQEHPTDLMLRKMGFHDIPESEKVVPPCFTDIENRFSTLMYPDQRLGFFQIRASQDGRTLPAENVQKIFYAVASEFPDIHWIGVVANIDDYSLLADPKLPNVEIRRFHRLRLLWSLIQRSEICISPDSMMVHVAGSLGIPCVGLWGLYAPEVRINYYKNHIPIFKKELCPHSPCNWNYYGFPTFCPPTPNSDVPRKFCALLEGITPENVLEAVHRALKTKTESSIMIS